MIVYIYQFNDFNKKIYNLYLYAVNITQCFEVNITLI